MASTPFIDPRNPGNITTPLPCEANWSKTFLPPVLGRLDHSPDFFKMKTKTHLRDPTTKKLVRDPEGNPIKDFTNIPPCISTNVEPWRIEAYFRLHGDFSYHNLWARQPIWQPKPNNAAKNKVNNLRARRVRVPLNMRAWNTKYAGRPPKTLVETVEILDQNQIDQNTTWDVTPKGIVQPGNPNHILPLGYFLENNVPHTPSKEVTAALELSQKLKAKAEAQGKNHWSELPSNDLPPGWIARISRSRAKVEISGDVKSEGDSEDKSEEGPEEEPHGKNVLSQARLNHMKMKFETSDESREESGQEPDDEPKEEPLRKQAVRGSRTVNMKRNVDPSDESSEEADAGGDEVEWVPQMNRRSKNSKVSSESSRGDRMKGSPAVGVSQRNEGKKRLGRPVNMDENYKPKSVSSGVVLKTSKTRCDEPSDKSSPAKSSPAKAKKRKLEHTNNGLPDPESPRIMAAIDPADAPDITPNAPRTPSSQTAPTIHTAETLRAMANGQPVSDQMIHEMLEAQAQNMLSEATLAFVFSGFVPFPSSPTSQHPSDPFQAEEPTLFPQHTWPTNSTTSHIPSPFSTIQPTMASLLADRAAMPPPLLPGRILSPPPPIDQLTERAEHWANQKAFIEGEQARMREPTVCNILPRSNHSSSTRTFIICSNIHPATR